jgi:hypothetical protein
MHAKNPMEIYCTTKFLLGTGLEQCTNVVNNKHNTALMEILPLVNRNVSSFHVHIDESQQDEFNQIVIDTIELLLKNNCDPNTFNSSGLTAIHKLIVLLDYMLNGNPLILSLPSQDSFKLDFNVFHKALGVLLTYGASPNLATNAGLVPLVMILQILLNLSAAKVLEYSNGFLQCISLLCENNAYPSHTAPVHVAIVTCLSKLGHKCLMLRDEIYKNSLSLLLKSILALLYKFGLNSNHRSMRRVRSVEGASGNVLVEMVKLSQYIHQPSDLNHIYDWVLTSLQWGANPDMEPYPSDPIIMHSQSSIFIKPKGNQPVNQFMYEMQDFRQIFEGGYAEKLLHLFYNSMDHAALYSCLNSAKIMSQFDPNRSPTYSFIKIIRGLSSQPRSLRQTCRVTIYKAIDRQLLMKVDQLPLPSAVKTYLINIE